MRKSLLERFEEKYIPEPMSGCWIWIGKELSRGYGGIKVGLNWYKAHRLSYQLYVDCMLNHELVCHKCDNRLCVNPKHLYAGTAKQNTQDMMTRGRNKGQFKKWDVCKNGHKFDYNNGKTQVCLKCKRDYMRARRLRQKNSVPTLGR
jgi:hypothetical protein